ncbi:phosphopantetheine-binding protein [Streptomyces sp. NPDC059096]|uniref:phosphopantetheine-binding protein n=1 Tax=unclassified Streptomyces TaxID=2593676 RepID=UPI0036C3F5CA
MTTDTRYEHLTDRLVHKFHVDPAGIRPEASLSDLDLDSLAVVELTMTLQDDWGISLDDAETPPGTTLSQLLVMAGGAPPLTP